MLVVTLTLLHIMYVFARIIYVYIYTYMCASVCLCNVAAPLMKRYIHFNGSHSVGDKQLENIKILFMYVLIYFHFETPGLSLCLLLFTHILSYFIIFIYFKIFYQICFPTYLLFIF